MKNLKDTITALQKEFTQALEQATTHDALEQVRVTYLGRKGSIPGLMASIKALSPEQKREFGPKLNALKTSAEEAFNKKKQTLVIKQIRNEQEQQKYFDVTAYKPQELKGTLHILTQIIKQLEDIFISMGYQIIDGPELDTDYYNFQALNIPADHPARDEHDTFWINDTMLLRTHASTIQIHSMEKQQPPLALFAPGRCFRNEATDASHDFIFTQAECLFIGKHVSLAHLMATAKVFLQRFFEKEDLEIRVRPGYFPFVEPGLEIDASCPFCTKGCSICKKTGWIELLGAGLVHPNVLECSDIDTTIYSGFAFGVGLERLAMIKYGINDIRLFRSSKIAFLDQF